MWNDEKNILGLEPQSPDPMASIGGALVHAGGGQAAVGDALVVRKGLQRQEIRIDAVTQKTTYAINRLTEIDQHAVVAFSEALKVVARVIDQMEGKPGESYMKAMGDRMVKEMARHVLGVSELGATEIARLVHHTPQEQEGFIRAMINRLLNPPSWD